MKVHIVIGTRPQYVKLAALRDKLAQEFELTVIDTGQHYHRQLSLALLEDLKLPPPDINLKVGSGGHGEITGRILIGLEKLWIKRRPDLVVVAGDTNSCLGGALAAAKLGIPVAHVEAGLRSFEKYLPEEINRVLTDHISELLFITETSAKKNLLREGIRPDQIHFVGNIMIDTLFQHLVAAKKRRPWQRFMLAPGEYGIVTLHRPENVDAADKLTSLIGSIYQVAGSLPLIFPVHPRTKANLQKIASKWPEMKIIDPFGYLDFIGLLARAKLVLTDSGGIQEESSVLGIPCVTLRRRTERPVTVEKGTNILAGTTDRGIAGAVTQALGQPRSTRPIPRWDGRAADRIVKILVKWSKV